MSLLIADFKVAFPEFDPGDASNDALIGSALSESALRINPAMFGNLVDIAQGYLTAHILTIKPYGTNTRSANDETKNPYLKEYDRMSRQVAIGFRVTGDTSGIVVG